LLGRVKDQVVGHRDPREWRQARPRPLVPATRASHRAAGPNAISMNRPSS
jgi:hypothetical protein